MKIDEIYERIRLNAIAVMQQKFLNRTSVAGVATSWLRGVSVGVRARPLGAILWLIISASIVLAPTNTLHEHVGAAAEAALVHDGHLHADDDDVAHPGSHIIDLKILAATNASSHIEKSPLVIMITCAAALCVLLQGLALVVFPSSPEIRPKPSRRTCWRPPLRGPPLSSY